MSRVAAQPELVRARRVPWLALVAVASLLFAIMARIQGPSDIWDRSQPKTISYTTDIIAHGGNHWILPIERAEAAATKPPLYNWLAVPFVKLMGFSSELAHKFPSVLALCLTWLALVRLGKRLDTEMDQSLGWMVGIAVVANHTMFKLGYLARPDMLLTLWLTLAWMAATHVLTQGEHQANRQTSLNRYLIALAFWLCAALAGLTKGPAALIALVYGVLAARMIGGSWRSLGLLQPLLGFPLFLLINGVWLYEVWRINPEHLTHTLLGDEVFGRVTGHMTQHELGGWRGWLFTMPYYVLYYFVRFLPWSVISIAAMVAVWRRTNLHPRDSEMPSSQRVLERWLVGASLQVVLVVAFFTLSTGKRADYIAAAFPPGALLASWWLLRTPPFLGLRFPLLAPGAAVVTLLAVTAINVQQPSAPFRSMADS